MLNPIITSTSVTPESARKNISRICNCSVLVHTDIGPYYIVCNPNIRPTSLPFTSPSHPIYGIPLPKTPFKNRPALLNC